MVYYIPYFIDILNNYSVNQLKGFKRPIKMKWFVFKLLYGSHPFSAKRIVHRLEGMVLSEFTNILRIMHAKVGL